MLREKCRPILHDHALPVQEWQKRHGPLTRLAVACPCREALRGELIHRDGVHPFECENGLRLTGTSPRDEPHPDEWASFPHGDSDADHCRHSDLQEGMTPG